MPLTDEHTGVVNALSEAALEDLSLQTTLQEILNLQGQHVIETHASFIKHTDTNKPTDKGVTLEQTLGILFIELEQFTSSTTNLGQHEGDTPDLALVAQTVLSGELNIDK